MKMTTTELSGVIIIEPKIFSDDRGFFMESYNKQAMAKYGIDADFVQDNHSRSSKNVLRGLHYQIQNAQGKLVRVVAGSVYDVVVDIRRSSRTFGRWFGLTLSAENKRMLWVPAGFAHGFLVTSEYAEFLYKTTDYYAPEYERSLRWDDPQIGIQWPIEGKPVLSGKDQAAADLASAEVFE